MALEGNKDVFKIKGRSFTTEKKSDHMQQSMIKYSKNQTCLDTNVWEVLCGDWFAVMPQCLPRFVKIFFKHLLVSFIFFEYLNKTSDGNICTLVISNVVVYKCCSHLL